MMKLIPLTVNLNNDLCFFIVSYYNYLKCLEKIANMLIFTAKLTQVVIEQR